MITMITVIRRYVGRRVDADPRAGVRVTLDVESKGVRGGHCFSSPNNGREKKTERPTSTSRNHRWLTRFLRRDHRGGNAVIVVAWTSSRPSVRTYVRTWRRETRGEAGETVETKRKQRRREFFRHVCGDTRERLLVNSVHQRSGPKDSLSAVRPTRVCEQKRASRAQAFCHLVVSTDVMR